MGKTTGFLEYQRALPVLHEARRRVGNWNEFHEHLPDDELKRQSGRCMNCGIPFCHFGNVNPNGLTTGCPVHNLIPEWNDLVYKNRWREAYNRLASTNNFPEFTGRICPAPCEASCVLGINEEPVMIKEIEVAIVDRAFEKGWIQPNPPAVRTGKKVAVIGSGPAGLACADELNKLGHRVIVYERADRIGGLLMYGIPNMKLDKSLVDRRVNLLNDEGIEFQTNVNIGYDVSAEELNDNFDAIVVAVGATKPRDLAVAGRNLNGVYYAMDYLTANTKSFLDSGSSGESSINVCGKHVIVIGGGDTGTDCVASSLRQGCESLVQFEILDKPADRVLTHENWLARVRNFQTDYGQEEAVEIFGADPREYNVLTKRFLGDEQGNLIGVETVSVEWAEDELGRRSLCEIAGREKKWKADAVFLALGFTGAKKNPLFEKLGIEMTAQQTIKINENKQTSQPNIFAAGDCERGQSLVVWAIADGRRAAAGVDNYLKTSC